MTIGHLMGEREREEMPFMHGMMTTKPLPQSSYYYYYYYYYYYD